MNLLGKILFWLFAVGIGFVNPLITFGLIFLYYLPGIVHEICLPCKDESFTMNSFPEDVLEEMK
ncbi:hypothetical protein BD31_I0777 [Candidatus Nitrosopumilus salaria BD31]|uniref:Uncharacterized protein n=1 Tax=Candidatus Nitrosopumilus salarius BD31 TaxID=859350 RepID=I3CZX7_9ARCH|nr:hypothetical protein [Candidatus Nitrosopumilus salaria]EIJ65020.1 hypothetical protein BD31_I0777 [Candidatus Nitrosopumilus salaria BD31]